MILYELRYMFYCSKIRYILKSSQNFSCQVYNKKIQRITVYFNSSIVNLLDPNVVMLLFHTCLLFWILMEFRKILIKVNFYRLYEAADIIQKLHLIGQVLSINILIIIVIETLNNFYYTYVYHYCLKHKHLFNIRNGTMFCSELTSCYLIRNCLKTGLEVLDVLLRQNITKWRNP